MTKTQRTYEQKKKMMDDDSSDQCMGYTWDEVSPQGKYLAIRLAKDLDILPQHAYMMLIDQMFKGVS
jgi:formamidopyrimidine-DNA glycosylase